jgi:hypothetical protein
MPAPDGDSYRAWLMHLKDSLYSDYKPVSNTSARVSDFSSPPEVLSGFEGNLSGFSVPNDNDMAISNDGAIVSVINSNMHVYNTDGILLHDVSLDEIATGLGGDQSSFDPRMRYDPINDRFILVFLDGFQPETSFIIVAFSQTNDPAGLWNVYELPGNPKDNDRWTDYPMIAITQDELFITGNLIIPGEPWQTGFSETLIWQMSLENGYNGEPLDAGFRDNVFFGGAPLRNLNPVQGGNGPAGPDMYFLSNRNFAESNDTIFMVHVTGTLDDPSTEVIVDFTLADIPYGVPPFGRQDNDHTFDTNDGRILGSFIQDNTIQFVSNTLDPTTGFCGVYHGVITNPDAEATLTAWIIGDDTLDLGYPDLSYTGIFEGDVQSIITCDHTAPEVFAGMSAFFYNNGLYSERTELITGDTYVNMISGTYERWGDYTGSQPLYEEPGIVWVSGNFGRKIETGPFTDRKNATWIASITRSDSILASVEQTYDYGKDINLYPVPTRNWLNTDINCATAGEVSFLLYDVNGNMIEHLVNGKAAAGWNTFTFDISQLPAGSYILTAIMEETPIVSKSFIVQ